MSWPCKVTGGDHRWASKDAGRGGTSVGCQSCAECVDALAAVRERDRLAAVLRGLSCEGSSGCPAHLVLNPQPGCAHGVLVGRCIDCDRDIKHDEPSLPAAWATVKRSNVEGAK